jgi:hypothetical protein
MTEKKTWTPIVVVILVGIVFQVILSFAESPDTPNRAVIEFAQAYFDFDPEMENRLCSEITESDQFSPVKKYIAQVHDSAAEQGYSPIFFISTLKHAQTETIKKDDTSAQIRLTATRKYWLRSLFTGEKFEVDEVFDLVREGSRWKVCGDPFGMVSG